MQGGVGKKANGWNHPLAWFDTCISFFSFERDGWHAVLRVPISGIFHGDKFNQIGYVLTGVTTVF